MARWLHHGLGMQLHDQTLGDLATTVPAATRVFLRHNLDFCCRGKRTLAAACAEAGLDADAIARELDAERARGAGLDRWDQRPLVELVDHIEARYHATLRRDVPPLIAAARKVERVHAAKPEVPVGLADALEAFWAEMQSHMMKEEQVLFPAIRRGMRADAVAMPIRVMETEHDVHGESLANLRAITGDHVAPAAACATWRALYDGLHELERELMEHIHLENHVLFPRAGAR